MINISEENKGFCCGCSACEQVCPVSCIRLEEDREGFLYPEADREKCIGCGKCEEACPVLRKPDYYMDDGRIPRTVGGWHKNNKVRQQSSSGAVFTLLAEEILAGNGAVYGCALDETQTAVHIRIDDKSGLDAIRGSKYVQSQMKDCYHLVLRDLCEGKKVLFTGTPCQCAGLHSFLNIKCRSEELKKSRKSNLYVCDFICHGVPSPKVFRSYIRALEQKQGAGVAGFRFRLKDKGWNPTGLQLGTEITYKTGERQRNYPAFKDPYMCGFLDDIFLRPACYECQFKEIPKYYADITFADFWGVKKIYPELYDGKGTSLVLMFSQKGEELFDAAAGNFYYRECDYEKSTARNVPLTRSADNPTGRKRFFDDYFTKDFQVVEKRYMTAWLWAFHKVQRIGRGLIKAGKKG